MIVNTNYCLKSNLPYLVFRVLLLSLLLFAAVGSISTHAVEAAGNTYYVAKTGNNSNPGTLAQPWLTIQKAASTLVAGDTVYIRAGTYNEQVTPANSGSAGSPITYQNYASESVILDGTSKSTSSSGLFKIQNKNYITLSGIQIQNSDYAGVFAYGVCDHVILQNLTIHNTGTSGICAVSTGWSTPQTLTNLTIDGCTLYHTNSTANQEAISLTAVNGFEIKNNTVHDPIDTNRVGIDVKVGSQNGSIHNNEVYSTGAGSNNIYVDAAGAATSNISIYNNNVHSGAGNGIVINDELQRATLSNINIYNNLIWGNLRGFVVNPTGGAAHYNFTFINNTLYNNGAWAEIRINTSHAYLSNSVVRNNIINSLTSGSYAIQYDDYAGGGITIDHNLFYNSGGSWRSGNVLGTGYITANPLLTSPPSNFSLPSNSPAIDAGSTAGAPATDYVGTSRPQGTGYDVGAYEYASTSASPPLLASIGDKSVTAGSALTFKISATSPYGRTLTYSASNLPSGAIFNPSAQTFSWTPTSAQSGTYPGIRFQVSDGSLTDAEAISIVVAQPTNPAPAPVANPAPAPVANPAPAPVANPAPAPVANPAPAPVASPAPAPLASSAPAPVASTNQPLSVGVGGGGGFVDGGSAGAGGTTNTAAQPRQAPADESGIFTQDYVAKSSDGICEVIVPKGTAGKTGEGKPLSSIEVKNAVVSQTGSDPKSALNLLGQVYDLSPEGADFDRPIILSIHYDPTLIPDGVKESDLAISNWDSVGLKWETLSGSKVDSALHVVSVEVSKFSLYAIVNQSASVVLITPNSSEPDVTSPGQDSTGRDSSSLDEQEALGQFQAIWPWRSIFS